MLYTLGCSISIIFRISFSSVSKVFVMTAISSKDLLLDFCLIFTKLIHFLLQLRNMHAPSSYCIHIGAFMVSYLFPSSLERSITTLQTLLYTSINFSLISSLPWLNYLKRTILTSKLLLRSLSLPFCFSSANSIIMSKSCFSFLNWFKLLSFSSW